MTQDYRENQLSSQTLYCGQIITVALDTVLEPDGRTVTREVVHHPGGVVALPIFDNGDILLIRQYRYAVGQSMLELPAGKLDPGEAERPQHAIERELTEETGYEADHWAQLLTMIPTPGFCDERLVFFKAEGLRETEHKSEPFIDIVRMPQEEARQMILNGEITDGKTLCLLSMYFAGLLPAL